MTPEQKAQLFARIVWAVRIQALVISLRRTRRQMVNPNRPMCYRSVEQMDKDTIKIA